MSTDVSEMRIASIIRAMSETSVDIQLRTRQYAPDDSELHTRRRENLKSHIHSHLSTVKIMLETRSNEECSLVSDIDEVRRNITLDCSNIFFKGYTNYTNESCFH
jgi:predicted RND superfamily exporter protein